MHTNVSVYCVCTFIGHRNKVVACTKRDEILSRRHIIIAHYYNTSSITRLICSASSSYCPLALISITNKITKNIVGKVSLCVRRLLMIRCRLEGVRKNVDNIWTGRTGRSTRNLRISYSKTVYIANGVRHTQ